MFPTGACTIISGDGAFPRKSLRRAILSDLGLSSACEKLDKLSGHAPARLCPTGSIGLSKTSWAPSWGELPAAAAPGVAVAHQIQPYRSSCGATTSSHAACKMQPVPQASLVMPIDMHLENQSPQGVGHNRIGLGSGSSGSGWTGHCYFTVPEDLRTLKFCAPSMIYDPRRGTLLCNTRRQCSSHVCRQCRRKVGGGFPAPSR